jgi:hypothetical protein
MYDREILEARPSPVENGEFIQGTWTKAFRDVDFHSIRRPYRTVLPHWARDGRLKEWESFVVQNERYHLDAFLANLKYFRIAQVVLYDKETSERMRFRKILPLGAWRLPRNLYNDSIVSRSYRFFFRIHNWLDADTISIDLDIEAARNRPAFTAQLTFDLESTAPLVTASYQEEKPTYSYKVLSPVSGDMVWGGRHITFYPEKTTGFFRDSKGFYPYLSQSLWCTAVGLDGENRCGFGLSGHSERGSAKNNENAFWYGAKQGGTGFGLTPLPPVWITTPGGIGEPWVIQDLEGMVDLTFTPKIPARSAFNLLIFSAEYQTPLGLFSGFLVNLKGERIQIRNVWGLGEKLFLRV